MPRTEAPVRAIGRLTPDGPWVGIQPDGAGYRLVFGLAEGALLADATTDPAARRAGLLAAAIAHFLGLLTDPPPELEATQADFAGLLVTLATDREGKARAAAQEALDAIDDGIQADAVALRLQQLLPPGADAVAILRGRIARLPSR